MTQKKNQIIKLAKDIFKFENIILDKKEEKMLRLLANHKISQKDYLKLVKNALNV